MTDDVAFWRFSSLEYCTYIFQIIAIFKSSQVKYNSVNGSVHGYGILYKDDDTRFVWQSATVISFTTQALSFP